MSDGWLTERFVWIIAHVNKHVIDSAWTQAPDQVRPGETLPAIGDSLGEEAQVVVDLHAVVDLQKVVFFVFEESQSVPEDHLQHTGNSSDFTIMLFSVNKNVKITCVTVTQYLLMIILDFYRVI